MKHLLLFLTSAIILVSCNCSAPHASDFTKETADIIQTDKDFNDYCAKHGQLAAFIKYADSSLIQMNQGELPFMGIEALKKGLSKNHDTISRLTWAPQKAEASENIGYTFGWWKYFTKKKSGNDTVYQGVYITIWKKQKDGSWKYVVDGGNDTPPRQL
jgi:ketosteroid isomerase-like protein